MNEWRLSEQVYRQLHRWPVLLVFVLCGALVGLALALIWSTNYEARQEIFVGINALPHSQEDPAFDSSYFELRNLDDYKNWQMEQLDQFLYTDGVLVATLKALQLEDPAWVEVTPEQLRDQLRANWRTAGRWELTATQKDRSLAESAVQAWSIQAVEQATQAVEQAGLMLALDARRQASARARSALLTRQVAQQQVQASLNAELEEMANLDEENLDVLTRQRLLTLAGQAAGFTPAWQAALAYFPPPQSSANAYRTWIAEILGLIQIDLVLSDSQLAVLETDLAETDSDYQSAIRGSYGLSPNLVVEGITTPQPVVSAQRPSGELVALGAVLGFLAWVFFALVQINRETKP